MDEHRTGSAGLAYLMAWTTLGILAGVMLLGVSGCDQNNSAESAGRKIDQVVEKAGKEMDKAAEAARQEVAQAKSAVTEKAGEAGKSFDDAKLSTRVKAALIAEPGLKSLTIDVSTADGIVTLHGTTDSKADREKAVLVASRVDGVKSVRNDLVVLRGS